MRTKIDLDAMSEVELRHLNREIIQRLQMHMLMRRKTQLMAFRIGDRVEFEGDDGIIEGVVTRVNQKTASIEADDGRGWRVSPSLLSKVVDTAKPDSGKPNLFSIKGR